MARGEATVVHKRMSFFASLVWGLCSVIMVAVLSSAGIVLYGMRIVDRKSDTLVELINHSIEQIPGIAQSVPLLSDALSDERRPTYREDLDIDIAFTADPYSRERMRAVIQVANQGQELVSLLSMRVVVKDREGRILSEDVQYVATPLAVDNDMPGPLMPGSTRRLTMGRFPKTPDATAEFEISDIRVWVSPQSTG